MGEKMQWSEAEAVVRAYRAEHGLSTDVDVAALAHALGTNVSEVRRLAGRKPRFTDRSGVLSAALALGVACAAALLAGPSLISHHPLLASLQPKPEVIDVVVAPTLASIPSTPVTVQASRTYYLSTRTERGAFIREVHPDDDEM